MPIIVAPPKPDPRANRPITVYLTAEEKALVVAGAKSVRLSTSAYARSLIVEYLKETA